MNCRCGHGRHRHQPTQAGRRGWMKRQQEMRRGVAGKVSGWGKDGTPDHLHLPCLTCGCRDWHPEVTA